MTENSKANGIVGELTKVPGHVYGFAGNLRMKFVTPPAIAEQGSFLVWDDFGAAGYVSRNKSALFLTFDDFELDHFTELNEYTGLNGIKKAFDAARKSQVTPWKKWIGLPDRWLTAWTFINRRTDLILTNEVVYKVAERYFENFDRAEISGFEKTYTIVGTPRVDLPEWSLELKMDYEAFLKRGNKGHFLLPPTPDRLQ